MGANHYYLLMSAEIDLVFSYNSRLFICARMCAPVLAKIIDFAGAGGLI